MSEYELPHEQQDVYDDYARLEESEFTEHLRAKEDNGRTYTMLTCKQCGGVRKVLKPKPAHLDTGLCRTCALKATGDPSTLVNCEVCGKQFRKSGLASKRRTCSMDCLRASSINDERRERGRARVGEANPAYRHGKRVGDAIRGWSPRDKGEDRCRNCGSTEYPQLHHVIPRSKHPGSRRELLNGITLCAPCHMGWHRNTLHISRDLFTADEWAYLTSVQLVGEDINAWLDRKYPAEATQLTCKNGHARTEENWYVAPGGHRQCRPCMSESERRRKSVA